MRGRLHEELAWGLADVLALVFYLLVAPLPALAGAWPSHGFSIAQRGRGPCLKLQPRRWKLLVAALVV